MEPVIGLDFGNFNSFPCFIQDFDSRTRMGGIVHDLLPQKSVDGIPSVFFYSKRLGRTLCGEEAVTGRARPEQNRLRYLKRRLGQTVKLDDRTISYDDAITEVVQYCIRIANKSLEAGWQLTTNYVSLSYPATYTFAQRTRLIELVERATLEDGRHIKVYGTIAEPAAAALDYLAEFGKNDTDTTVLTYDLGGGTFDLGLVSAYPKGKKNRDGGVYYYDIINTGGLAKLGGAEFDEEMIKLVSSKIDITLDPQAKAMLKNAVETAKIELSDMDDTQIQLFANNGLIDVTVTRKEFENATMHLLKKTINATKAMLDSHANQKPDIILLTGGASQMPMVKREMEKAFPEYKGKIKAYRPSRSIAYGAARYGTEERNNPDPVSAGSMVVKRLDFDLGVQFYIRNTELFHIGTFIKAGTEIPCETPYMPAETHDTQSTCVFDVYEANKQNPDEKKWKTDYTYIMGVTLDFGRTVPKGYKLETKLMVDKRGVLTIKAREKDNPSNVISNFVELKNLSN